MQGRDTAARTTAARTTGARTPGRSGFGTHKTLLAGAPGRQRAGEHLRHAILAGDMAPGQRLIEEELAGMLAVTRASLRGALFDLAAEGLVERIPNRGARVRVITIGEAVAITECRMALEGLCAAKAAELVTDAEAARLHQLGEQMQRSVADGHLVPAGGHEGKPDAERDDVADQAEHRAAARAGGRLRGQDPAPARRGEIRLRGRGVTELAAGDRDAEHRGQDQGKHPAGHHRVQPSRGIQRPDAIR